MNFGIELPHIIYYYTYGWCQSWLFISVQFFHNKIAFKIAAFYDYDTLTSKCQFMKKMEREREKTKTIMTHHDIRLDRFIYLDLYLFVRVCVFCFLDWDLDCVEELLVNKREFRILSQFFMMQIKQMILTMDNNVKKDFSQTNRQPTEIGIFFKYFFIWSMIIE